MEIILHAKFDTSLWKNNAKTICQWLAKLFNQNLWLLHFHRNCDMKIPFPLLLSPKPRTIFFFFVEVAKVIGSTDIPFEVSFYSFEQEMLNLQVRLPILWRRDDHLNFWICWRQGNFKKRQNRPIQCILSFSQIHIQKGKTKQARKWHTLKSVICYGAEIFCDSLKRFQWWRLCWAVWEIA